jgi:hypothetical protein
MEETSMSYSIKLRRCSVICFFSLVCHCAWCPLAQIETGGRTMWQFVLVIIVEVYIWIALALSISKYHPKLLLPPWCPCIGLLSHTEFLHMLTSLPVTRVGGVKSVYVDCTSPSHQFGLLVALASAWSLIIILGAPSKRSKLALLVF